VREPKRKVRRLQTIGNRLAPARFLLFLALLPVAYFAYRAAMPGAGFSDAAAVAFDAAAVILLVSLVPLLRDTSAADMREHAAGNDANRVLILAVTSLLSFVAMAAITGEMDGAQRGEPTAIATLIGTLLLIWLFANSVYALHYAHAYYAQDADHGGDIGGLDFPGTKTPDYGDFAYFAFTLGMTFQTSDVATTLPSVRRVALLHSFTAFIFNIGVIAFTINVLGGS
jgi:uncharacterized membrane protein